MSVLTRSGRAAIAQSIALQPIHLAWGTGNTVWGDTPPAEDVAAEVLLNEVGRRTAFDIAYAEPDEAGEIVTPTGRYRRSANSTSNLYLAFRHDFGDGAEHVIRELAVFVGTEMVEGLPEGQRYFLPIQVANPGTLLVVENSAPIHRSMATRETFEFVVTF
jgi:hypothetical protein